MRLGPAGHGKPARLHLATFSLGVLGMLGALVLGLAACYSPTPAPGLPCSEDLQCPDGQVCSANDVCIVSGSVHSLHDDDENDFDDDDAVLQNAILTGRGFVEAAPWMNHGLRVTSIARATFDDAAVPTWESLTAEAVAGQAYFYNAAVGWADTGTPPGLGFAKGTDVSVLVEGELYLDVGVWKLELRADDAGFLDLAEPGTATYRRLLVAKFDALGAGTLEVKVAGWYPVRMAMSNKNQAGNLSLRGAIGAGVPATFDASRLRAAVPGAAVGLIADAFDSPSLMHFRTAVVTKDIRDLSFADLAPPDSGITSATSYSMRWSGQFYVASSLQGFTITTAGAGHRVWIDGTQRADKPTAAGSSVVTGLALERGWHDLVIELEKRVSGATTLSITGLEGDQDAFAPESLRPVPSPALRWLGNRTSSILEPIPEAPLVAGRTFALPSIAGTVSSANVEFTLTHTDFTEVALSVRWGAITRTIAAAGSMTGMGRQRRGFGLDPKDYGMPAPGASLVLNVTDATPMLGTGTLEELSTVVRYADSSTFAAPFAKDATYISDPRELGDVVAFGKTSWKLRDPAGVTVEASLRTCADKDACATAEWVAVDGEGLTSAVPARYLQYRIILRTDGTVAAALDSFTLEYYSTDD